MFPIAAENTIMSQRSYAAEKCLYRARPSLDWAVKFTEVKKYITAGYSVSSLCLAANEAGQLFETSCLLHHIPFLCEAHWTLDFGNCRGVMQSALEKRF